MLRTKKEPNPPPQILQKREKGMAFAPSGTMASASILRDADSLMKRFPCVTFKRDVTEKRLALFFTDSNSAIAGINRTVLRCTTAIRFNRTVLRGTTVNSFNRTDAGSQVRTNTTTEDIKERKKKS